jgi:hypothetical protein
MFVVRPILKNVSCYLKKYTFFFMKNICFVKQKETNE